MGDLPPAAPALHFKISEETETSAKAATTPLGRHARATGEFDALLKGNSRQADLRHRTISNGGAHEDTSWPL